MPTIAVVAPGKDVEIVEMPGAVVEQARWVHDTVGGYFETQWLPTGLVLMANDRGLIDGLPANRYVQSLGETIHGTFLVVRREGLEIASLTRQDQEWVKDTFNDQAIMEFET
jgi:hypothetical protein